MKKINDYYLLSFILIGALLLACKPSEKKVLIAEKKGNIWKVDFLDDFTTFNDDNWQDQRIWVNNETHCYVPDGEYGTREVSNGTLKLKVINTGKKSPCDNLDKHNMLRVELYQKIKKNL